MQQTVDIEDKASGITAAEQEQLARKFQKELNAGLVALVLLAILDAAEEDLYGYQIAKRLEREGGPVSLVKQGALYPVLRTLSAIRRDTACNTKSPD